MSDPKSIPNPYGIPSSPAGWSRGRILFLTISGVVVVTLFVAVREVLLPFIIAMIIAYVLTPLVQLCERARMPRSVSILAVYAVTLSLIYRDVTVTAPALGFIDFIFTPKGKAIIKEHGAVPVVREAKPTT